MEKLTNRYAVIVFLLLIFGIVTLKYHFRQSSMNANDNILSSIPQKIGQWEGHTNSLDERVYRLLETRDVLVTRYVSGRDMITLQLVYYPEVKASFHDPEACNAGTGDKVERIGSKGVVLNSGRDDQFINMNAFVVYRTNGNSDLFFYFFKSGEFVGDSYIRLRLRMGIKYLMKGNVDCAMIVFSTPMTEGVDASGRKMIEFIKLFYPFIQGKI